MFGSREYTDETSEDQLKTSLGFLRWKLRDRRLLADDVLQFRDEFDNERSVRIQGVAKCIAPFA